MKRFILVAMIILFCFGVLPEYIISESSDRLERTTREVQTQIVNKSLKTALPTLEEVEKVDDVNYEIEQGEKLVDDSDEIKIKPWLKKSENNDNCENGNSVKEMTKKHLPIEEKMLNDHKRERANKEVPGSNRLKSLNEKYKFEKSENELPSLRIVDNATVVFNEGIVNVKLFK